VKNVREKKLKENELGFDCSLHLLVKNVREKKLKEK